MCNALQANWTSIVFHLEKQGIIEISASPNNFSKKLQQIMKSEMALPENGNLQVPTITELLTVIKPKSLGERNHLNSESQILIPCTVYYFSKRLSC